MKAQKILEEGFDALICVDKDGNQWAYAVIPESELYDKSVIRDTLRTMNYVYSVFVKLKNKPNEQERDYDTLPF